MLRLLFEKSGNAVWISHLDLMRLFQRAFKRAGLPLTHTQGFNPRPSVSIALPLSVGVESNCELLDFTLDGETVPCEEICKRLNEALVPGVRVREVYDTGRKLKELAFLDCVITLEYDKGIPADAQVNLRRLFSAESLIVPKKGKNGIQDQDIIPLIKKLEVVEAGEKALVLQARICCQNPSLNPMQLVAAIGLHLPELKPDFAGCKRLEIYDLNQEVFR
jgi:radical SAM-linked protein